VALDVMDLNRTDRGLFSASTHGTWTRSQIALAKVYFVADEASEPDGSTE